MIYYFYCDFVKQLKRQQRGYMQRKRLDNFICYLIMFFSASLMTVISPMLAELARDFHLTLSQSGLLYTAEFTGFTVFVILSGILADKIGKRIVLTAILAILVISLYAFSISSNFYLSLAIMLFAGGFCGPLQSIVTSIISDLNPSSTEKHVTINTVFYGIGGMAGPVVAGLLITNGVPWRTVYVGLAVFCIAMLAISFLMRIPKTKTTNQISFTALKSIIKDWRFMLLSVCIFLYGGAECSAWAWMSEYMKYNLSFSVFKSSIGVGVFWLSITIGRIIILRITEKVSARLVMRILALVAAVVTFVSAFVFSEAFAWIVIALMGLFYSSQFPIILGQAGVRHKEYSGTTFAILICSAGIAMAIIPALIGVVTENISVFVAQILPAFLLLILLFVYSFATKPEKKEDVS